MSSKINVISAAFLRLGKAEVTTIDPVSASDSVKHASFLYDQKYPAVLASHPWTFATVTARLVQINVNPSSDRWKYYYQLPVSPPYVRAWRATRNGGNGSIDYQIFQNILATNSDMVLLEYTGKISEEFWTPDFNMLMIDMITAEIAMPITQNPQLSQYYVSIAKDSLVSAKNQDSQSQTSSKIVDDPFLRAHLGGGFGGSFGNGCGC